MSNGETHVQRMPADGGAAFRTTHWTLVLTAGDSASPDAAAALEGLCRAYWYPLYAYIRRRGHKEHDAQDLTQGFFAHLLEGHRLRRVERGHGKFRTWLLTALNHFLADEHDRQQALKRGGGREIVSFDAQEAEQRYRLEPVDTETPEKLFERRWATALLNQALARLEQEFVAAGKTALLHELRGFLAKERRDRTYAQAAAVLDMSEEAVKKAVQRMRQRYQEILREAIRPTVDSAAEVEEELCYLQSVVAG